MDIRTRERLVGALILVLVVVLLVPAVLTGRAPGQREKPAPESQGVEILLEAAPGPLPPEQPVPEPELPGAGPVRDSAAVGRTVPLTELAAAVGAEPAVDGPSASGPAAETEAWAVQLGAFRTQERANELVRELRARGYRAFVLEYRAGGQILHRVRVGPEQDRARADAIAERLKRAGYTTVVAPHP